MKTHLLSHPGSDEQLSCCLKGGTHIAIIGMILLRFYPFLTTENYLVSYKIILYDYPVVCGVSRVNLSR